MNAAWRAALFIVGVRSVYWSVVVTPAGDGFDVTIGVATRAGATREDIYAARAAA